MSERGDLRDRYLRTPVTPKTARACNKHEVCDCIAWERQWYFDRMKAIQDLCAAVPTYGWPMEALAIINDLSKGSHPSEMQAEIDKFHAKMKVQRS